MSELVKEIWCEENKSVREQCDNGVMDRMLTFSPFTPLQSHFPPHDDPEHPYREREISNQSTLQ